MSRTKTVDFGLLAIFCVFFSSTFARADTIYVSNFSNNTVEKFDSNGQGTAFANSGLNGPTGIALDSSGNVYVANYLGNSIVKFDPSGQDSVIFDNFWTSSPNGLAFDTSGNLYEAIDNGWVVRLDPNGNGSTTPGTGGALVGLAFDTSGNIYASGYNRNVIYRLRLSNFQPSWSGFAVGSGLNGPGGLAFDGSGNLYVANYGDNTIEKFDSNGNGTLFASSGLSHPLGIAFGSDGDLYVANSGNNTIEEFDPSGHGSVFASSGLDFPAFIAVQIPEPTAWALVVLGSTIFLRGCRLRHRLP